MRRVDLDALVGDDVDVVWRGVVYPVPADLPTEVILGALRVEQAAQTAATAEEQAALFAQQADLLDSIVRLRTPGASIAAEMGPATVAQAIGMIAAETQGGRVADAVADDAEVRGAAVTVTAAVEAALGADPPTPPTL